MDSGAETRRFWGGWAVLGRHSGPLQMAGLAAIALVLYLFELGKGALPDWDAAIYAEVTKEMLEGHHWLTPYWNHQPFFEKPPLFDWLQMISFGVLGRTELAARLESALAGAAVVLLVYAMTRRTAGSAAGLFAGLVLLTTHNFDQTMRGATTDPLLCLCIFLTVYGYVRLREGDGRWFYLMCAALGLGIMTKGPAALVAPMAIGLDWGFRRRRKLVTGRQVWLGLLLLGGIAIPWHVWMVWHYGWAYVSDYLGHQILARASRPLQGNIGGLQYYFRVIGRGAFPWSVLGVVALVRWVWKREWEHALPWLMMGVTLGLYTAVQTKLQWYVVPLYPALAMEVGRLLSVWGHKWRLAGFAAAVVLAVGLGVAFDHVARWPGDHYANEERQLGLAAKAKAEAGPLIVVGRPGNIQYIDIRTVLYYSGRDVVWQQLPDQMEKLEAAVSAYPAVDVVTEKRTVPALGRAFRVRVVEETKDLELAVVSRNR